MLWTLIKLKKCKHANIYESLIKSVKNKLIYSGKTNQKSSVLGLFEIPGELLSADAWRSKTLNEKANIYFHDYSLAHLIIFVKRYKKQRYNTISNYTK